MKFLLNQKGVTLLELAATITVIGIAIIGLSISYQSIMLQYQQDMIRNELVHYSSLVIQRIAEEANKADKIEFEKNGSFMYIDFYNDGDVEPYLEIYGDPDDGVVFDEVNADIQVIRFPNFGENFDDGRRAIQLRNFEVTKNLDPTNDKVSQELKQAYWTITTEYVFDTDASQSGRKVSQVFVFERNIYLPKVFIREKLNKKGKLGLDV